MKRFALAIMVAWYALPVHGQDNRVIHEPEDQNGGRRTLAIELACGLVGDQAVYASFGFETQPVRCQKLILRLESQQQWGHYRVELAPIYDEIKTEQTYDAENALYKGNADGGALFLDWYKNLGTQTYYLGEERVREAYIGSTKQPSAKPNAQRGWHFHWRFGRQKGLTGIDNEEQIWGDNAKFAPYTFWLTSNLYTGVVLGAGYKTIDAQIGVFSGNNPLKGYGAYYADADGVSTLSPNTKGNNTPTAAGRITHRGARVYLAISGERNRKGSSWAPALLEGKRYSDLVTLSWRHRLYSKGEINVHGESMGTYYRSGLIETASQAARAASPPEARADEEWGEGLYREFQQRGGYAGVRVAIKRWTLAAFVERFDRLDYNVWCGGVFRASYTIADETTGDTAINCDQNDDLREAVQESRIYWLSYAPNEQLRINTALHHIDNPAPGVSEILPEHGDSRLMIQIALNHQQGF